MVYDKINGDVGFLEEPHKYVNLKDDSIQYTSVTTMIERYGKPFDKEFTSKYKALERLVPSDSWKKEKGTIWKNHKIPKDFLEVYNISEKELNKVQQEVLDEWEAINKESCERGTKIHSELENSFYNSGKNVNLQKFGIGGKFECKKDYNELNLEYGVYPEYLIYYDNPKINLHIAGQIDLLVKNGNDISIIDHKGLPLDTPILTSNGWSTMGDLKVGDKVFDKDGNLCSVTVKSSIHHNPCYRIKFDNNESIIADVDHRWLISFKDKDQVMTTLELKNYLGSDTLKILNTKPLNLPKSTLKIDPYVLGVWLGIGSDSIIQTENSKIWNTIKQKGFSLGSNLNREGIERRAIYELRPLLNNMGLLDNKHIPNDYLLASYSDRLQLLRGLMDTIGYFDNKKFIISFKGIEQLISSLGCKVTTDGDSVSFTSEFNPFLCKDQEIEYQFDNFRIIKSVEKVETVPTQCIAVDSPSHTYLCTHSLIVTHNTNKKIDTKGFYNSGTRSTDKMLYPLRNLDECNYNHYQLQLSTYAWMLQKRNPDFIIKNLILNHYDHDGKNTLYHCTYLKDEVEKMLKHYAKQLQLEKQKSKYARIEY